MLPPADLAEVLDELCRRLPYPFEADALAAAARPLDENDAQRLDTLWGALFEVGHDGPPIPLREELATDGASKEEVVRFYDFFGYRLAEEHQWCPDQLSILLEFLHFLCYGESRTAHDEARSFALAQLDFTERHLLSWTATLRDRVSAATEEPYLVALFDVLHRFLNADRAYRRATVSREE